MIRKLLEPCRLHQNMRITTTCTLLEIKPVYGLSLRLMDFNDPSKDHMIESKPSMLTVCYKKYEFTRSKITVHISILLCLKISIDFQK